ncbi:hypothetical protein QNI19_29380 [Cytophagaceae bacterium DM2B3-1]|uniref:Uncharacterized protein n=1 Tax=Xanthocytophaga flava TaxID=3048013 RepID=A0ABT7CTI8_9BACT|nr:hypothetical protein [Xanthocytophaga flavus]MDJ1497086.1 hypothetical protein [Xanthocytophaga flavus]
MFSEISAPTLIPLGFEFSLTLKELIILSIILLLVGWAIYQGCVYVIRKWTGLTNIRKIRFRALVATFILTPLLILLVIMGLVLYTILKELKSDSSQQSPGSDIISISIQGISPEGILLLITILLATGFLAYQMSYYVIRRGMKLSNVQKIRIGAFVTSLILTQLLIFLLVMGFIWYSISNELEGHSNLSQQLNESIYDMTRDSIDQMHLQGKTKSEVVDLLGGTDTTGNELIYDLSMNKEPLENDLNYTPEALFLVVTIKNGKVIRYNLRRKK